MRGSKLGGERTDPDTALRHHIEALRRLLIQARALLPPGDHDGLFEDMRRTLEATQRRLER